MSRAEWEMLNEDKIPNILLRSILILCLM